MTPDELWGERRGNTESEFGPAWDWRYVWEPRPHFREPHPVRALAVTLGAGFTFIWYVLFGVLARNAAGYVWLTLCAGFLATVFALVLAVRGDRGVAVGIALASSFSLTGASVVLLFYWLRGDWLLW